MARFLALDWDHHLLHVVAATTGRGGVRVQKAVVWEEGEDPNPADAEALGRRLAQRLKEAGIAPAPVLASVGRDRVILKDVRYPQVPASEEPAVVRFQTAKELTHAADEVVIDYTPVGEPGPAGDRRALALVLRRELLAAYQALCRAAGLKLAAITPRPFGIAACASQASPAAAAPEGDGAVAVLTVTSGWAEFCVARGGRLLFTRAVEPGPGLVGAIRRNLALYAGQPHVSPRDRVQALYVAGNGEHNTLREQLEGLLAIPVHPLDPFAGAERVDVQGLRGGFGGAVGLLHLSAGRGLPIDLAHPKEPRPERDPNRRRYALAAALAVLVLVAGFALGRKAVADKRHEVEEMRAQVEEVDGQISTLQKDSDKLHELQGWTEGAICWLDQLADLSRRFPDTRRVHLTELSGSILKDATGKKQVAQLVLNGQYTGEESEVNQFIEQLGQEALDRLPRITGKKIAPPDDRNPGTFNARIDLSKPEPEKPAAGKNGKTKGQAPAGRRP